jgi:farnesyl-diphosphate farnesyltransferase
MADTLEDDPNLSVSKKVDLLERFSNLFPYSDLKEDDLNTFRQQLPPEWKHAEHWDQLLTYHCHWLFPELENIPVKQTAIISKWVQEMCLGMGKFTQKQTTLTNSDFLIRSIPELDEYCYYVAGTVGNMLCELFANHSSLIGPKVQNKLNSLSVSFGLGLQLTNILKDVTEDIERNIMFIPESLSKEQLLTPENFFLPENKGKVSTITQELIVKAQQHLRDALEYTCALPKLEPRLRLFCLWPLFLALETLVAVSQKEYSLEKGQSIKISRQQVYAILKRTGLICWSNKLIRKNFEQKIQQLRLTAPSTI